MPSTKRKSNYDTSDPFIAADPSPSSSSPPPTKRNKQTLNPSRSKPSTDSDGNPYWPLSTARRVTVSDFKGKKMISIREYYQKDGEWLPGKKGITMTVEQYAELLKVVPMIERALSGERLPRVVYDDGGDANGNSNGERVKEEDDDDDEKQEERRERKANIEATSDEDED